MGIPIFIHLSKKINILFIYIWGLENAPEAPGKTLEDIFKGRFRPRAEDLRRREEDIYIYIYISCAIFILRFAYLPARRAMKPGGLPRGAARKVYEL
jgi:hypothetical protein